MGMFDRDGYEPDTFNDMYYSDDNDKYAEVESFYNDKKRKDELIDVYYEQNLPDVIAEFLGISSAEEYYKNDLPNEKLLYLESKYFSQMCEIDSYGEKVPRDTLKEWYPKSDDNMKNIFDAARYLGRKNDLGMYFRLLSDLNFSRGFWLGSAERLIRENNLAGLNVLKGEIDELRTGTSEKEMEHILTFLLNNNSYDQVMYDKCKKALNGDYDVILNDNNGDSLIVNRFKNELDLLSKEIFGKCSDLDGKFEIDLPEEKLVLLEEKYLSKIFRKDSLGNDIVYDPLKNWYPDFEDDGLDGVIYSVADYLGRKNELGKYFRLLSDSRFAHYFWSTRAEKLIEEKDIEGLTMLKDEIEELRPETSEKEMESIVTDLLDVDDELTDAIYDFAAHLGTENELGKYFKGVSDSNSSDYFLEGQEEEKGVETGLIPGIDEKELLSIKERLLQFEEQDDMDKNPQGFSK